MATMEHGSLDFTKSNTKFVISDLENILTFFYSHLHHFILSGHHIGSTILNLAIPTSDS